MLRFRIRKKDASRTTDEIWIRLLLLLVKYCQSESCSVMSNSLRPLYYPWNSQDQNSGVGSLSLLQGSSQPRDQNQVSHIAGGFFAIWDTREALSTSIQGWFSLGLTDLISLHPGVSQESSLAPQFKSIQSLVLSLLYGPALTSIHDYWKNHSFD